MLITLICIGLRPLDPHVHLSVCHRLRDLGQVYRANGRDWQDVSPQDTAAFVLFIPGGGGRVIC